MANVALDSTALAKLQSASDLGMNWIWFKTHEQLFTNDYERHIKPLLGDELKLINAARGIDSGVVKVQKAFLQNIQILCSSLEIDQTKFSPANAHVLLSKEYLTLFKVGYCLQETVDFLSSASDLEANAQKEPTQQMTFLAELADAPDILSNIQVTQALMNLLGQPRVLSALTTDFRALLSRYLKDFRTWRSESGVTLAHYKILQELNVSRMTCIRKE
jgi:hypothetical protein